MDGCPLPVAPGARSFPPGWVAAMARIGQGGHDRYVAGVRLLMVLKQPGGATGWALAAGHVQARGGAAWLCSPRAGGPGGPGPRAAQTPHPTGTPPTAWMAVWPSAGAVSHQPLLSASGCRSEDGRTHGAAASAAPVCPRSKAAPQAQRRWGRSARQGVATTLANLRERWGRKYPGAHTRWGWRMRVAANVAA